MIQQLIAIVEMAAQSCIKHCVVNNDVALCAV